MYITSSRLWSKVKNVGVGVEDAVADMMDVVGFGNTM
jgi:hypothetical protein